MTIIFNRFLGKFWLYSLLINYAHVAQLVELGAYTSAVPGSSPGVRTKNQSQNDSSDFVVFCSARQDSKRAKYIFP